VITKKMIIETTAQTSCLSKLLLAAALLRVELYIAASPMQIRKIADNQSGKSNLSFNL
jgi:hypothetical protein